MIKINLENKKSGSEVCCCQTTVMAAGHEGALCGQSPILGGQGSSLLVPNTPPSALRLCGFGQLPETRAAPGQVLTFPWRTKRAVFSSALPGALALQNRPSGAMLGGGVSAQGKPATLGNGGRTEARSGLCVIFGCEYGQSLRSRVWGWRRR